jgi:hypothetical protein
MNLTARIVAAAFVSAVAALAVASWDIARGRAPETASPLMQALLADPENRTCDRDVSALVARFVSPGMTVEAARGVLSEARVAAPSPWFWTPASEDRLEPSSEGLSFTRVLRYTAFGNHRITGLVRIGDGRVEQVIARSVCAFG